MKDFSPGETLASIQSMMIYTIMKAVAFGLDYFVQNRDMLLTMKVG